MKEFQETDSVHKKSPSDRLKPARFAENIAAVRESVTNDPSTSIRHRCQELGIVQFMENFA